MPPLFLVMIGGAVGAAARYLLGVASLRLLGSAFPWGTLAANVLGGFLMGVLAAGLARLLSPSGEAWRLLLGVGVLGGFTTFSSFSLETLLMIDRGRALLALAYVLVSVAGALGALQLGRVAVRAIP